MSRPGCQGSALGAGSTGPVAKHALEPSHCPYHPRKRASTILSLVLLRTPGPCFERVHAPAFLFIGKSLNLKLTMVVEKCSGTRAQT